MRLNDRSDGCRTARGRMCLGYILRYRLSYSEILEILPAGKRAHIKTIALHNSASHPPEGLGNSPPP